jgi:hypothetical protein
MHEASEHRKRLGNQISDLLRMRLGFAVKAKSHGHAAVLLESIQTWRENQRT